jgi:hypothetical protein
LGWCRSRYFRSCIVLLRTYVFTRKVFTEGSDAENAPNKWKTWWIIFCLIMGVVLIVVFVFVESKVKHPLMPLSIWKVPQFPKLMLCFGLGFGAFGGSIIFGYSLYFQQIYQASSITVLLHLTRLIVDYIILCTAVFSGSSYECCRCVYSAYCAWEDITCDWIVMLCDRGAFGCCSTFGDDILGHVISRYEYIPSG